MFPWGFPIVVPFGAKGLVVHGIPNTRNFSAVSSGMLKASCPSARESIRHLLISTITRPFGRFGQLRLLSVKDRFTNSMLNSSRKLSGTVPKGCLNFSSRSRASLCSLSLSHFIVYPWEARICVLWPFLISLGSWASFCLLGLCGVSWVIRLSFKFHINLVNHFV